MGWNDVQLAANDALFEGMAKPSFYFLHSYHVVPKESACAIAHADYGRRFACAIRASNVVGVQFHPEKSHHWGERLLLNFARS
jgi:glutamine amidotransferase